MSVWLENLIFLALRLGKFETSLNYIPRVFIDTITSVYNFVVRWNYFVGLVFIKHSKKRKSDYYLWPTLEKWSSWKKKPYQKGSYVLNRFFFLSPHDEFQKSPTAWTCLWSIISRCSQQRMSCITKKNCFAENLGRAYTLRNYYLNELCTILWRYYSISS